MRLTKIFFLAVLLFSVSQTARASQPRDWKLNAMPDGTDASFGIFFPGAIGGVEYRHGIYGAGSNQLRFANTTIATFPFMSTQLETDLRVLCFQPGIAVGFNDTWRNYSFAEGEDMSRDRRRDRYASGQFDNAFWPYFEGRTAIFIPFNDYVLLHTVASASALGAPARSYDWQDGLVRDGGLFYKWETWLYLHHKKFGAFGPELLVMDFKLDNTRHTQVNYGFQLVTRAGLSRYDDLIALQMLFHTGSVFGGYDNTRVYGSDTWRIPFTFLIAYLSNIPIYRKTSSE